MYAGAAATVVSNAAHVEDDDDDEVEESREDSLLRGVLLTWLPLERGEGSYIHHVVAAAVAKVAKTVLLLCILLSLCHALLLLLLHTRSSLQNQHIHRVDCGALELFEQIPWVPTLFGARTSRFTNDEAMLRGPLCKDYSVKYQLLICSL